MTATQDIHRATGRPPGTYRVDCCHNGGEPVPQTEVDDDADGRENRIVMGIGLLVAALEAAVLLVML